MSPRDKESSRPDRTQSRSIFCLPSPIIPRRIDAKWVRDHDSDPSDTELGKAMLAELLRAGLLSPVYHGQNSTAAVKHLGRSYAALTEGLRETLQSVDPVPAIA